MLVMMNSKSAPTCNRFR